MAVDSVGRHAIQHGAADAHPLVLDPWRGIRILSPADDLALPPPAPADSPA